MNYILYALPILIPVAAAVILMVTKLKKANTVGFTAALLTVISAACVYFAAGPVKVSFSESFFFLMEADKLSLFFMAVIAVGFALWSKPKKEYEENLEKNRAFQVAGIILAIGVVLLGILPAPFVHIITRGLSML